MFTHSINVNLPITLVTVTDNKGTDDTDDDTSVEDVVIQVERVEGGAADDSFIGDENDNTFVGGAGNDKFCGRSR